MTVFGRHAEADARDTQGGILNFEILQDDGMPVSYRAVQEASASAGFHLRTGAECNPGACYSYLGLTEAGAALFGGMFVFFLFMSVSKYMHIRIGDVCWLLGGICVAPKVIALVVMRVCSAGLNAHCVCSKSFCAL